MTTKKKTTSTRKTTETLVAFILDKSGSMVACEDATVSGFNEYIGTLQKKKEKFLFSLTLFDTEVTHPHVNTPLKDVKELDRESYRPDGMTALYDAVCTTMSDLKKDLKKNQKVLFVIMTDGEENSSKEYTDKEMRTMIKELEDGGNVSFVFLGANQDSYAVGQKFGIAQQNITNYNATDSGTRSAFTAMAANTADFSTMSASSTSTFFSKEDQDDIENA